MCSPHTYLYICIDFWNFIHFLICVWITIMNMYVKICLGYKYIKKVKFIQVNVFEVYTSEFFFQLIQKKIQFI